MVLCRSSSRSARLAVLALLLPLAHAAILRADEAARLPTPASVEVEGVPPIPEGISRELARYQDIRSSRFLDWAPDGSEMLIARRHENLSQLHLVGKPGAAPRVLTHGDEPVYFGLFLADGSVLFSRGSGGNEQYQLHRIDRESGEERLLTDGSSRNLLSALHPDGRLLAFSSTLANGRDADLYLLDLETGAEPRRILEVRGETWGLEDWEPDGSLAVARQYVSRNQTHAVLLDTATGERRALKGESGEGAMSDAGRVYRSDFRFGPSGRRLLFLSDARGEFRELARLDLETGRITWPVSGIRWDIESLELSRDRRRAALTINEDGYSALHVIDDLGAETLETRRIDLRRALIGSMRFSPDGTRLGLTIGRPSAPAEAYSLDLSTGELRRWTFTEQEGFSEGDFVEPELIRFRSFDGLEVPAFLYRPKDRDEPARRAVPVIVTIHGGPESQYRPWFSASRQYYVRELGAAVIAPNVRGSTGYGKSYSLLDNGRKREDSVRDIGALLDWIRDVGRKRMELDPDRVAVVGGSYGGYMVLASLILHGERLRAGIASVGVSDFITFLENTSDYRRELRRAEYGDERDPDMRAFFERISPARRITALESALLLIHGKNDPRVPFSETVQVVERARSTGQTVWTVYAENEGHGFRRKENRDYEQAVRAVFLREFLLGGGDGSAKERSAGTLRAHMALPAEIRKQLESVLAELSRVVDGGSAPAEIHHRRANVLFRLGRFEEALRDYDRAAAGGQPHTAESCWERGLAHYYLGDHDAAIRQFEGYHRVDALDIENGLWRYLCIAERDGLDRAVSTLLPYPRKVRTPFPALHDLYSGRGTRDAVLDRARGGGARGPTLERNLFYAHYYIGKYLEARGEHESAREHFREALSHEIPHFMYDCARIDLARTSGDGPAGTP